MTIRVPAQARRLADCHSDNRIEKMGNKMTKKQRNELKKLIDRRTKWDAATLRITKTGGITVKLDLDKLTGLTKTERALRMFIGHYPEILTHL